MSSNFNSSNNSSQFNSNKSSPQIKKSINNNKSSEVDGKSKSNTKIREKSESSSFLSGISQNSQNKIEKSKNDLLYDKKTILSEGEYKGKKFLNEENKEKNDSINNISDNVKHNKPTLIFDILRRRSMLLKEKKSEKSIVSNIKTKKIASENKIKTIYCSNNDRDTLTATNSPNKVIGKRISSNDIKNENDSFNSSSSDKSEEINSSNFFKRNSFKDKTQILQIQKTVLSKIEEEIEIANTLSSSKSNAKKNFKFNTDEKIEKYYSTSQNK